MTTVTTPRGPTPLARPRCEESIPRIPDAPIYEALARGWVRAGRAVPGRHDREWAELAGQSPWPDTGRRRATTTPAPPYGVNAVNPYGVQV